MSLKFWNFKHIFVNELKILEFQALFGPISTSPPEIISSSYVHFKHKLFEFIMADFVAKRDALAVEVVCVYEVIFYLIVCAFWGL